MANTKVDEAWDIVWPPLKEVLDLNLSDEEIEELVDLVNNELYKNFV